MSVTNILLNDAFHVKQPSIYYCEESGLYDYPFLLCFEQPIRDHLDPGAQRTEEQNTITQQEFHFYFHKQDYTSASEMLQTRAYSIMNQLFLFAMDYFEQLQDLCVENESESEFMQIVILDTVALIYPVLQLIESFYRTYSAQADAFYQSFQAFLQDFVECFCLLEDYFPDKERIQLKLFHYLVEELFKKTKKNNA